MVSKEDSIVSVIEISRPHSGSLVTLVPAPNPLEASLVTVIVSVSVIVTNNGEPQAGALDEAASADLDAKPVVLAELKDMFVTVVFV